MSYLTITMRFSSYHICVCVAGDNNTIGTGKTMLAKATAGTHPSPSLPHTVFDDDMSRYLIYDK
jgi:AAA+ superfamily predicted ATPase